MDPQELGVLGRQAWLVKASCENVEESHIKSLEQKNDQKWDLVIKISTFSFILHFRESTELRSFR